MGREGGREGRGEGGSIPLTNSMMMHPNQELLFLNIIIIPPIPLHSYHLFLFSTNQERKEKKESVEVPV